MTISRSLASFALAAALALPAFVHAQDAVPAGTGDRFKDTSILKLEPGQRAQLLVFEDLECPACARAFPIEHEAIDHYKIAYSRHDFPLSQHPWSRQAAITARYLQDKVSNDLAYQYRRDVFANQMSMSSPDDLQNFTRKWFAGHGQQMPFVIDPSGRFAAEVQADATLGERLGVQHTPTLIVIGPHGWTQVTDVTNLYSVIDNTLAQSAPASHPAAKRTH